MSVQYYEGIGRRKESSASVRLMNGQGKFVVNEKPGNNISTGRVMCRQSVAFPTVGQEPATMMSPSWSRAAESPGKLARCSLGLARALVKMNIGLHLTFAQRRGLLTRDPRIKERKKPGLKRARKAPTYTKR